MQLACDPVEDLGPFLHEGRANLNSRGSGQQVLERVGAGPPMMGIRPSNAFQKALTLASATGLITGPPRPPNPPFGLITTDSRSGSITSALPTELISERKSTGARFRTSAIAAW